MSIQAPKKCSAVKLTPFWKGFSDGKLVAFEKGKSKFAFGWLLARRLFLVPSTFSWYRSAYAKCGVFSKVADYLEVY